MSKMQNQHTETHRWIDDIGTGMNACSLEVLRNFGDNTYTSSNDESMHAHPLIIGCYELTESNDSEKASSRNGEVRLYMVEMSDKMNEYHDDNRTESTSVSFCNKHNEKKDHNIPAHCCQMEAGVLDGKWFQNCPIYVNNDSQSETNTKTTENESNNRYYPNRQYLYATACASGNIWIHALKCQSNLNRTTPASSCHFMEPLISSDTSSISSPKPICLSLDLDESNIDIESGTGFSNVVSSYSDGNLAVHTAYFSNTNKPIIEEKFRWKAHSLFHGKAPAEVWACCWAQSRNNFKSEPEGCNLLLSGGDDGVLKGWDTRTALHTQKPIFQIGEEEHSAGVTVVSWHPTKSTVFASGSYDEGVRIWDIRCMTTTDFGKSPPQKIASIDSCGGGIWRLKWHPTDPSKLLVGAMHGGCRVLNIPALEESDKEKYNDTIHEYDDNEKIDIISAFTAHESMAYGADWLVTKNESSSQSMTGKDIAASCSFYDRKAFLWQTNI